MTKAMSHKRRNTTRALARAFRDLQIAHHRATHVVRCSSVMPAYGVRCDLIAGHPSTKRHRHRFQGSQATAEWGGSLRSTSGQEAPRASVPPHPTTGGVAPVPSPPSPPLLTTSAVLTAADVDAVTARAAAMLRHPAGSAFRKSGGQTLHPQAGELPVYPSIPLPPGHTRREDPRP